MPSQNFGATDEFHGQKPASGSESNNPYVDKNQRQAMLLDVYHNLPNVSPDLLKESENILKNVGKQSNLRFQTRNWPYLTSQIDHLLSKQ